MLLILIIHIWRSLAIDCMNHILGNIVISVSHCCGLYSDLQIYNIMQQLTSSSVQGNHSSQF